MSKKNLDDLRRERATFAAAMTAAAGVIDTLEAAGEIDAAALATAQTEFEAASADFNRLDGAVKRGEAVETANASAATGDTGTASGATTVAAVAINPNDRGAVAGLMLHALMANGGDKDRAVAALDEGGFSGVGATLQGADQNSGGVLIPQPQVAEVIELLGPNTVVRKAGARSVPVSAGELRNAKQTGSASAAYGGENETIASSAPSFEPAVGKLNELRTLVPISNTLLGRTSLPLAKMVLEDMLEVMRRRQDLAWLRGSGAGNTPKGAWNWILAGHKFFDIEATVAAADEITRKLVDRVEDADVSMTKGGWIMRASTKNWLSSLKDATGRPFFPSIEEKGELRNHPIFTTSQIPNNLADTLASKVDGTDIIFADWHECMIGESGMLQVAQSTEAAYTDANGVMRSAFSENKTLIRAITEDDFAPRHDVALSGARVHGWSL